MSPLVLLLRHELRSVVRDRRTIVLSVLVPLFVMPLLLFASREVEEYKESVDAAQGFEYAVAAEELDALVLAGNAALDADARPGLTRVETDDPAAALEAEEIDAWLDRDDTTIAIRFRADKDRSRSAVDAIEKALEAARRERQAEVLRENGFPVAAEAVIPVVATDTAEAAHVAGSTLSNVLTLVVVFLVLVGGQVVAADLIAGEKERGTLETLLTTAARRVDIIRAKLLTILVVALAITAINLGNLLAYASFGLLPGADTLTAALPPAAVLALALVYVPVALLIAALLLLLSGYARSYKEAQLFMVPVQLFLLVPAAASLLPTLELRSAIVLAPIANASVAARDVLTGHFDWPMLVLTAVVDLGVGLWLARVATRALSEERLVTPSALESAEVRGGPDLFRHHVLRWVAGVWAVVIIVSINAPGMDIRAQLLFNLVVMMLGTSILVARRYRLDVREAWSLRAPARSAWLGVLVAVPSGMVVAHGVFHLASLLLPVPEEELRRFSDVLLPEDIPRWQLLAMATVLPGVCEEIFFRGTLLHGLRKRFGPVALCLVVGLIFGIFHFSLFRIFPTASLGVGFAAATLLTRSIYPAMLWHTLNNLLGLSLADAGLDATELPAWAYPCGIAGLVVAFAIFRRR